MVESTTETHSGAWWIIYKKDDVQYIQQITADQYILKQIIIVGVANSPNPASKHFMYVNWFDK